MYNGAPPQNQVKNANSIHAHPARTNARYLIRFADNPRALILQDMVANDGPGLNPIGD